MALRARSLGRWSVPVAVLAGITGFAVVPHVLPASAAVPSLPPITPTELLDKVRTSNVRALSGTVKMSSHLGLPDLGALGVGQGTMLDLLTGSHTSHIWIDGPEHLRVALDAPSAESDWIRNGSDLWAWRSDTQSVQHTMLAVDTPHATDSTDSTEVRPSETVDPTAMAAKALAMIEPSTTVTIRTPDYIAGRAAYELVLTPKSANSTVGDIAIGIDAENGVPLAVRIDAKNSTTPAVSVAFSQISYATPDASTFAFSPPPGSTVSETDDPTSLLPIGESRHDHHGNRRGKDGGWSAYPAPTTGATTAKSNGLTTVGSDWDSVAIVSGQSVGGQLGGLLSSATTVQTAGGPAKLISTSLVNALVLDDGRIAVGAVTPDALAAAVPAN
jgi:outer membrane lipoprotein-sorting protein